MEKKYNTIKIDRNIYNALSLLRLPGESFNTVLGALAIKCGIFDKEGKVTKHFLEDCSTKRKRYIEKLTRRAKQD